VNGQRYAPAAFYPPGKTRNPLYRRLGGPQGWAGLVRKISHPLGFDPRTVHPVTSRYTVWATRPTTATRSGIFVQLYTTQYFRYVIPLKRAPRVYVNFSLVIRREIFIFGKGCKGRRSIKESGPMIELLHYFCVSGSFAGQHFSDEGILTQIRTGPKR
jgi:hypothetical protein